MVTSAHYENEMYPPPNSINFSAHTVYQEISVIQPVEWMVCARCCTRHLFLQEG